MLTANKTATIWTVYDHPREYPDRFVAREFDITPGGITPANNVLTAPDLDTLRTALQSQGLVRTTRSPDHDPTIVEAWV
jgi:hypothetical protein